MYRNTEEAKSAFELKREGDFGQALRAYAGEYAHSLRSENSFIADMCFDQMFDTCLLKYLKEGHYFASREELLGAIERQLAETISQEEVYDDDFRKRLASCRRKLFPRGRATGGFSVDAKWLLEANLEERTLKNFHN